MNEEKEDGSDDSEEDDDEDEEEERIGDRGRDAEGKTEEKRTQSLDRALRPSVSPEIPQRTRRSLATVEASSEDAYGISTNREVGGGMTMGRGTKGRGKQSRGTMLWSSDAPPVPEMKAVETADNGLGSARTEFSESLVPVGSASEEEQAGLSPVRTPLSFPKDEIDLLEEEGKISPRSDLGSVLQPAISTVAEAEKEEEEGMEEVELEEAGQNMEQDEYPHQPIDPIDPKSEVAVDELEEPKMLVEESQTDDQPVNAKPAEWDFESEEKEEVGDEEGVLNPAETAEVDRANDEAREAI